MSNETNQDDIEDDAELEEGLKQKKLSGKKIIMIAVPILLLLAGGVGAYMFMGGDSSDVMLDENGEPMVAEEHSGEPTELLFYDIEPMLVNLTSAGGQASYLKLTVTLEVDQQSSIENLQLNLPRIIDNFQVYLRELRLEDINGSAGMFRLKEELLIRVNETIYPTRVNDVLFKEMLING